MKTQVQECSIKNDFSPLYVISLSPVEDSTVESRFKKDFGSDQNLS